MTHKARRLFKNWRRMDWVVVSCLVGALGLLLFTQFYTRTWVIENAPVVESTEEVATSTPETLQKPAEGLVARVGHALVHEAEASGELKDWIVAYSEKYGVSLAQVDCTVKYESGYRLAVYGDNGRAYGPAQFHRPTFDRFKREAGMEYLQYENPEHQIQLLAWAFSQGYEYQNDWTVFRNKCRYVS